MYKLICKKPAHSYLHKMAVLSSFLQVFIVLGTYIFSPCCCCCPKMAINKQFPPRWMAERTFEAPKEKRLLVLGTRVLPSISMVFSLYHRKMNLKKPTPSNTKYHQSSKGKIRPQVIYKSHFVITRIFLHWPMGFNYRDH